MTLFWLCVIPVCISFVIYGLQLAAAFRATASPQDRGAAGTAFTPPVSVLKPLKGLDDDLFDNLESFCVQDYPAYEVIFSLQDHNDPAYRIARMVREKHRDRNIVIVVERCGQGLNPKVNNLIPAYRAAKFDTVLISDSNVAVRSDYLRSIARRLADPSVGLVTNLIRGAGNGTVGSLFENLHLNSFIVGSVSFLDRFLGMPCVIGKSMLMRKADFERIGGFAAFRNVLAEDFVIGREMHRSGKRVVVDNHLIENVNRYWGFGRFLGRHSRWAKLRWKIGGVRYFTELLANPVFLAALPLAITGPSFPTLALCLAAAAAKVLGDGVLGRRLAADLPGAAYLLVPVKDLIVGCLWFAPFWSDTVLWRGNRYRIVRDSRLVPAPETGLRSLRYRLANSIRERFA